MRSATSRRIWKTSSGLRVETLRPYLRPVRSHELGQDADAALALLHASAKHIRDVKPARDVRNVRSWIAKRERSARGRHREIRAPRQQRNDVSRETVGKILLLGVGARVDEWKHGDRLRRGWPGGPVHCAILAARGRGR